MKESFLQELADADEGELIKQVQARRHQLSARLHASARAARSFHSRCAQEYYADYWALDGALVSLELENNVACFMPQTWESPVRRPAGAHACRACARACMCGRIVLC